MTKYIAKTALLTVLLLSSAGSAWAVIFNDAPGTTRRPVLNPNELENEPQGGGVSIPGITGSAGNDGSPPEVGDPNRLVTLAPDTSPGRRNLTASDLGSNNAAPLRIDSLGEAKEEIDKIFDATFPRVAASGRVNSQECLNLVKEAQATHELVAHRQAQIQTNISKLPSAGAISCSKLHQARIANVAIDLLKSNGVQGKIFSALGGDAASILGMMGITNGFAKVIGASLLSSITVDVSGLGPLEGIFGGGPINVSARDCKLMEKLSKPRCVLGSDSILAKKNGDGTAENCVDDQVLATLLGVGAGLAGGQGAGAFSGLADTLFNNVVEDAFAPSDKAESEHEAIHSGSNDNPSPGG